MSKFKIAFSCTECGQQSFKWMGKCPNCLKWNTFEENEEKQKNFKSESKLFKAKILSEISEIENKKIKTGVEEFDRVMGGGIELASITLIGGEPGVGKSSLLITICGKLINLNENLRILYVSGEESETQIAKRAQRLRVNQKNIFIINENIWENIVDELQILKPDLIVIDSIQTIQSKSNSVSVGSANQIKDIITELIYISKNNLVTCLLVGHVTKEGLIAGPKNLEHLVDSVAYFEGDEISSYRFLRMMKNRFGNSSEVGVFEIKENELIEIKNPTFSMIDQSLNGVIGRSISTLSDCGRALFVEIQALVVENKFSAGKRVSQGVEINRINLLIAIIDKYLNIPISLHDIYLNIAGGIKNSSRENDLSIIASLLSSYFSKPIPEQVVFLGEVGLSGEIRPSRMIENQLREIQVLNFKKVVLSRNSSEELTPKFDLQFVGISKISELKELFFN